MQTIFVFIDSILIQPYRTIDYAPLAFLFGTWILTLWCIALGDILHIVVSRMNKKRLISLQKSMRHYHILSEKALAFGDKASFKAVNAQAHDAFGHYFSFGAALFCVSVSPIPFAMAWLDGRFVGLTPIFAWDIWIIGQQPSGIFWFLLLYIPSRMVYSRTINRYVWYTSLRPLITNNAHGEHAEG